MFKIKKVNKKDDTKVSKFKNFSYPINSYNICIILKDFTIYMTVNASPISFISLLSFLICLHTNLVN